MSARAITPKTAEELAAAVRDAADAGATLELTGGATRRAIGRPVEAQKTISTKKLSGITNYDPAELVIVARAGTPLADIEKALDANNQRLVFEPADLRGLLGSKGKPTIGSVAATNNSGPRRFVSGAARDSLLGVRFVNGRGEAISNGGRVMKNVTGLDLVKLMAGSWGTLGLLTEVTFKVLPKPETETTLVLRGLGEADAVDAMAQAMATPNEVSGAAHLPELVAASVIKGKLGPQPATLLRIEGFADSVAIRIANLRALLGAAGDVEELGDKASRALWRDIRDVAMFADDTQKPVWKVSMAPSEGHRMVMDLRMHAPVSAAYDWQGGLIWLRMEDGEALDEPLRAAVQRHGGGHATLIRADEATRAAIDVFQPLPAPVAALSKRIKDQFDPAGIFNPGRMSTAF